MTAAKITDDCMGIVQTVSGVSNLEAREILEEAAKRRDELAASGKLQGAERDLARWGSDRAQEAKVASALQRKHAALNILKRKELDRRIEKFIDATGNVKEAFLSILVGSHKKVEDARKSVFSTRVAISHTWMGSMFNELGERPHVMKLLERDKTFLDQVVREMHEIKPDGKPGITGNDDARFVAGVFGKYTEGARIRLNEAGAFIRKLDGWVPQSHDASKLIKSGQSEWVRFALDHLDMERSFPEASRDEAEKILEEVYDNIITGKDRRVSPGESGEFQGPRNLARSMGKSRVLHFRDADSFLAYHERFGRGSIMTSILNHLDMSARKLSLMEMLGPNPETMLKSLMESERRRIRESDLPPKEMERRIKSVSADLSKRNGAIGRAFSEVMGETLIPENVTWAKIGSGVRAVQSMAKLGGAALSSIADLMTYAMNARHNGINLFEAYGKALESVFHGKSEGEIREISHLLGTMYDGMLGDISARWNAQDNMPGKMSELMNTFFKFSGLTYWTDALKSGYSRMLSSHLGEHAGMSWQELPDTIKGVLGYHGLTERHWEAIRSAVRTTDGKRYLLPEKIGSVSNDLIDGLEMERIEKLRETMKLGQSKDPSVNAGRLSDFEDRVEKIRHEARKKLETDLMAFFSDETRYAVIEPDDRTRMAMVQGTRPGSIMGELARFITQFKSFPIAYYQRNLSGKRFMQPGRGADLPGITHLIAGSLVLGYAAGVAKDLAKGRTPKDPTKFETWMAAAIQSGGAGIYGDFLLAKYDRFGGTPVETAAGPTAGTVGELIKISSDALRGKADWGDAFHLGMNNTPFINLWYTRAALDYSVLFHVREMISPGTLARSEKRMRDEYNQQYVIPPSRVIQTGGGFR